MSREALAILMASKLPRLQVEGSRREIQMALSAVT